VPPGFDATDGGVSWKALAGEHRTATGGGREALTGASGGGVAGSDDPARETETDALDAYAGKTVQVRFLYRTDEGLAPAPRMDVREGRGAAGAPPRRLTRG
jgi:hypothetical protein